jgi:hypothetical protein
VNLKHPLLDAVLKLLVHCYREALHLFKYS